MNLAALANSVIQVITPNIVGSVRRSIGATVNADFTRTPTYTTFTDVQFQVQALSGDDLKQLDALNIQGIMRAVYANMQLQGVDRVASRGGDLLDIATGVSGNSSDVWLVTQVLEPWDTPGWTKVAVTLQVTP